MIEVTEFNTDSACAYHNHTFGLLFERHGLAVFDDLLSVNRQIGKLFGATTGSDDEIFEPAKSRLQSAGLLPEKYGWHPDKITTDLDGVIVGMHAKQDNPELLRALELGIQTFSFPEFIYHHSRNKTRLVMAGSHGKTTCTGMLMHILKAYRDFDYLVGSQLPGFERMVRLSDAPLIVIEGDEYLTSPLDHRPKFVHYKAHAAMITGIAWDHVNVFPTEEIYHNQFSLLHPCIIQW
jgi:UDP-N-acetylmuramate: L-alanyl-gamma-D-glutamyl-meso-diaminopimelate ligase